MDFVHILLNLLIIFDFNNEMDIKLYIDLTLILLNVIKRHKN